MPRLAFNFVLVLLVVLLGFLATISLYSHAFSRGARGSTYLVAHHGHRGNTQQLVFSDRERAPPNTKSGVYAPLKVFMYDLPPEFHFGMIQQEHSFSPWPNLTAAPPPRYPGGLHSQHSVEYWLTADLLASSTKEIGASIRVYDPQACNVLFVPFFSSLSYNKFSAGRGAGGRENDRLEQELVTFLESQQTWKRSGGRDHVIVMHHPNSLKSVRSQLREAMFVVADFGRFRHGVANVDKDVVAPYKHVVPTFENDTGGFDSRDTLLFFQGAIVRKEGGVIRQQLHDVLKGETGVQFLTGTTQRDGIRSATIGMRNARFCLHPAGDTPSSNRLFDAIASHCVPVIVSDEIELPFEDEIDYSEFCVFVESREALKKGMLVKLLRGIGRDEWTEKWERLKQVLLHFEYQYPSTPDDAVQMIWKAISRKLPLLKLRTHKGRRYVHE